MNIWPGQDYSFETKAQAYATSKEGLFHPAAGTIHSCSVSYQRGPQSFLRGFNTPVVVGLHSIPFKEAGPKFHVNAVTQQLSKQVYQRRQCRTRRKVSFMDRS